MLFVLFILCLILTVKAVIAFDAINWILSKRYREHWIAFGSPPGFLRSPDESKWLSGTLDRQRMVTRLFFSPPKWMLEDTEICKRRKEYMLCWVLLMVTVMIAAFFVNQ
jgi:hypothetical protein